MLLPLDDRASLRFEWTSVGVRSGNRGGGGTASQDGIWGGLLCGARDIDRGPRHPTEFLENNAERLRRDSSWCAAVRGSHTLDGVHCGRWLHSAGKLYVLADIVLHQSLRQVLASVDGVQLDSRNVSRCRVRPALFPGFLPGNAPWAPVEA